MDVILRASEAFRRSLLSLLDENTFEMASLSEVHPRKTKRRMPRPPRGGGWLDGGGPLDEDIRELNLDEPQPEESVKFMT